MMLHLRLQDDHAPVVMTQFPQRKDYIWLVIVNDESMKVVKLAALHNQVINNSLEWMQQLEAWLTPFLADLAVAWSVSDAALVNTAAMLISDYNSQADQSVSTLWIEGMS